jgi:hypothetical protein
VLRIRSFSSQNFLQNHLLLYIQDFSIMFKKQYILFFLFQIVCTSLQIWDPGSAIRNESQKAPGSGKKSLRSVTLIALEFYKNRFFFTRRCVHSIMLCFAFKKVNCVLRLKKTRSMEQTNSKLMVIECHVKVKFT